MLPFYSNGSSYSSKQENLGANTNQLIFSQTRGSAGQEEAMRGQGGPEFQKNLGPQHMHSHHTAQGGLPGLPLPLASVSLHQSRQKSRGQFPRSPLSG